VKKVFTAFILLFLLTSSYSFAQEKLTNGNFETDTNGWSIEATSPATGTLDLETSAPINGAGSAHVVVTNTDGTNWHLQFSQIFGTLTKDKRYYITFTAKASADVSLDLWVQQYHDSYSILFSKTISLTSTAKTFTDSVDIYEDDPNAKIGFVLGLLQAGTELWFDDISIVEADIPEQVEIPTTGVVGPEKIVNGRFENGKTPWELELQNGGAATYEIETTNPILESGSAHVTVTNSTGTDWHVQFKQAMTVLKGRKYYILFQARASQNVTVLAGIQQYHSPYSYLTEKNFEITTETQTFLDTSVVLDADDSNVKFTFMLGNIGNVELWIDNVTIIEFATVQPLDITIDAAKDEWYNSLTNPDDGLIHLPSRAYLREGAFTAPTNDNDLSMTIYSAWDTTYLYYYAEVKDDIILVNNSTTYQNDNLEIKYDPDPSIIGTSGAIQTRVTAYDSSDALNVAGVDNITGDKDLKDVDGNNYIATPEDYARAETDGGYILEWRIPLKYLNKSNRKIKKGVGSVFGCAINIGDNDDVQREHMLQWSAGMADAVWSNPKLHGKVTFLADNKLKYEAVSAQDPTIVNDSASVWYYGVTSVRPDQISGIPESFELLQNYPNPFNPTTVIEYSLTKPDNISLSIYNILGQEVRTLVSNEIHNAGKYKIIWDAKDNKGSAVSSGVYLYRLTQGSNILTKKMMLIR